MSTHLQSPLTGTDLLPWQSKGRWYKMFAETDGTTFKMVEDAGIFKDYHSDHIFFKDNFRMLDYVLDGDINPSYDTWKTLQGIYLQLRSFTHVYVYVFGYFE